MTLFSTPLLPPIHMMGGLYSQNKMSWSMIMLEEPVQLGKTLKQKWQQYKTKERQQTISQAINV